MIFNSLIKKIKSQIEAREELDSKINSKINLLRSLISESERQIETWKTIKRDTSEAFPWLAKQISTIFYSQEIQLSNYLRKKPHPAIKSADYIAFIAEENKLLREEIIRLEAYVNLLAKINGRNLPSHSFLSTYANRTGSESASISAQQAQMEKNTWIGARYEAKVALDFWMHGYQIIANGLESGRNDNGIDLICYNKIETLLVQCKCWSKKRTIDESIILNLHSDAMRLIEILKTKNVTELPYPVNNARIMIITSTTLDKNAKNTALSKGIEYKEDFYTYPLE